MSVQMENRPRETKEMAYLGKEYKCQRQEKFDEFFASLGIPKDQIDNILAQSTFEKLVKDGDTYSLTLNSIEGVKTLTFKSGVEFVEKHDNYDVKAKFVVDGNTIVQTQKFPDGRTLTFKREFTDNKFVMTATNSAWDGVAYRYYSA